MHDRIRRLAPVLPLVLSAAVGAQKTPDIGLSNPSHYVFGPRLLAFEDRVGAAWMAGSASGADVWFARSADRGNTWSAGTQLSVARVDDDVELQLCGDGDHVYAAWIGYADGKLWLNRSADGGATWLAQPVRVDREPGLTSRVGAPHVVSAGAHVFAVYESQRNGRPDVYFNCSTDGGLTWLPNDVRLDTDAPGARTSWKPRISIAGSTVWAVWYDDHEISTRYQPRLNVSTDGGTTWLAQDIGLDPIVTGTALSRHPRIVSDGVRVHVAFESSFQVCIASSDDTGAWWSIAYVGAGAETSLAMDGDYAYVCWVDKDIWFSRSTDGGASWSGRQRVDRSPLNWEPAVSPRLAVAGPVIGVCWLDSRPELIFNPDIYFTRSTNRGATWPPFDTRVSTVPKQQPREPALAAHGATFFVLWNDGDIRFNIPYGVQPYGAGTAGAGGFVPRLLDQGAAVLGSTVHLRLEDGLGGAPGAWFIGAGKTSLPFAGGTLLVAPALTLPFFLDGAAAMPGAGAASLPLPMPLTPSAVGASLYFQGLVVDPQGSAGLSFSDARELWIG